MCRKGTWCGGESLGGSGCKTDHTCEQQGTDEERAAEKAEEETGRDRERKRNQMQRKHAELSSAPAPKHRCNYHSNNRRRQQCAAMRDTLTSVVEENDNACFLNLKERGSSVSYVFFAINVKDHAT